MKAENAPKGIINSFTRVVKIVQDQFVLKFHAIPQHFTRLMEKFDVIENYKIRDGF
jgi:hypothetical protein